MTSDTRLTRLVAVCLLAATALTTLGFGLTPWEEENTAASYHDALAAHPGQAEAAAVVLHFGFLLFAPAAAGLVALLWRDLGKLGWAGAVLATLGVTSLPGLLITDAYDLVLAQELPRAQSAPLTEQVDELLLPALIGAPAALGTAFGPVLLLVALARQGRLAWAAPALLLAGWVVPMVGWGVELMLAGGALLVAAAIVVARTLERPRRTAAPLEAAPAVTSAG